MDAHELFKIISFGIHFDLERFPDVAERFNLKKKPTPQELLKVKEEPRDVEKSKDDVDEEDRIDEEDNVDEKDDVDKEDDFDEKDSNVDEKNDLEETVSSSKRKHEDDEEDKPNNVLTLLDGITADEDGTTLRPKKKKKVMTDDKILKLEQEKINQYRNKHHISVTGSHVPAAIKSFEQLSETYNVKSDLLQNMKDCGYSEPTPIQMQAMPVMLQGRSILACAPTGSGKTAAFLLPIIHHLSGPQKKGFRAVIISPTRELAKQTYRECMRLSEGRDFRVHIISKIKQALTKYGPKSNQKYDILITTPQRLVFLLNQEPPAISLSNVEWLVVDEADKLFEEGTRSFKEQLQEISKACTNPNLRYGMFSATNTPVVTKWCRHNLKGLVTVTVGHRNATADTIDQQLLFVGTESGKLLEIRSIIQKGLDPPVLIFVDTKKRAEELFKELIYDGINVDMIHSERTQTTRDNVVRCFREGKIWVLICTEMMARGIDFKGVNLVINYDFPKSAISYIHRIGRTGRAGHKGKAITFFTKDDTANLRSIATKMREAGCEVPDYMLAMKKHSKKQRRKMEREAPKRERILTTPKADKDIRKMFKRKLRLDDSLGDDKLKSKNTAKFATKQKTNKKNSFKTKRNSNGQKEGKDITKKFGENGKPVKVSTNIKSKQKSEKTDQKEVGNDNKVE